ncbi:hypothetical protein JCM10207_005628 [Rhodosporidiobolus poonsookiae]
MFRSLRLVLLAVVALAALSSQVDAGKSSVYVTQAKQASQLQAAAVMLKPGNYKFTNVQTKKSLYYVPKGNHIYPQKGKATKASVTHYSNKNAPWHRFQFGSKNKCLSSAWGSGGGNNAAVMYVCADGKTAQKTTLEKTKQWWLLVPVSKPLVASSSNSAANQVLLAAQADSIATRKKKEAALKKAFGKRSDLHGAESARHGRMMREVRKRALEKRAKTVSSGTFYIIAVDHLLDRTAAVTSKVIKTHGVSNTVISTWKKGNKAQQWKITRA